MCNIDVSDSVLDNFLCTHEEDAEQFANTFTMLTSEDRKAIIEKECECYSLNVNNVDNKSECQNTLLRKYTHNSASLAENAVMKKKHNDQYIEATSCDNKDKSNENYVQLDCIVENEHFVDEMEAVELSQEYGKEVYTGGLANCITCNAIDIIPCYDNFMNTDGLEKKDDNANSNMNESWQEHISHASESVRTSPPTENFNRAVLHEECNVPTEDESTALLLEAIMESCECVNSDDANQFHTTTSNDVNTDDDNDSNKCVLIKEYYSFASTNTNSTKTNAGFPKEEEEEEEYEINHAESDQECCSLNSSINLPGIDSNEKESFLVNDKISSGCSDGLCADDGKITKVCVEREITSRVTTTRELTSDELAKLKSIVEENDDCVHAYYTCDKERSDTNLEKEKVSWESVKHSINSTSDESHLFNDVLGDTLRHHTFAERVEATN